MTEKNNHRYDHKLIEKKWQKYWQDNHTFKFVDLPNTPKIYVLDMFPYPSAKGLHVGHPKGYVATDIVSRYHRLKGYSVLHPIGWDAFGLPAEQFALNNGKHPESFTLENIDRFRVQLRSLGFDFDYDKEVNTTDPNYYKWTQWIFIELYKHGLADLEDIDVNWCEQLKCVLSNEEVLVDAEGKCVSERGGFPVVKRPMRQWILKITAYADKLIEGLNEIEWPESLKAIQRNWIGRSEGMNIEFKNNSQLLKVFTTRPDTIFGVTFFAISPKHKDLWTFVTAENKENVKAFIANYDQHNDLMRQQQKELNGVFSGSYMINPFTKESIPIWIADYVMVDFGTGAIMATPAHSEIDFRFAKKYNLPIKFIVETTDHTKPFTGDGIHINSDFLNGLNNHDAIEKMDKKITELKIGEKAVAYKLRDWIFSRQRYWGEPIPVVFDQKNNIKILDQLPLLLPKTDNIKPTNTGESPLANLTDWVNIKIDGVPYRRETNTMPQWAGSCWYYLAYIMKNDDGTYLPLNSPEAKARFKRWLPVDLYVGGQEHAVLHLLYARFWHRFLYDIGIVPTKEPFHSLVNQGMILGPDGSKMSKSKGNVINPDDIIESHGADALRLYEMFMGPISASLAWDPLGLDGLRRWLNRVYRLYQQREKFVDDKNLVSDNFRNEYIKFINDFVKNIEKQHFNLCISNMMVFINSCHLEKYLLNESMDGFLILLSCFAPHLAEELYAINHTSSVCLQKMPQVSGTIKVNQWVIPIQINGKLCITIETDTTDKKTVLQLAKTNERVKKLLGGKTVLKEIYVPGKIVNFVIA